MSLSSSSIQANAPVVMFQWHAKGDHDELEAIRDGVANELARDAALSGREPQMTTFTSRAWTGRGMLRDFCRVLRPNPGVQIIYFSAHGEPEGIFHKKTCARVTFAKFGEVLEECMQAGSVELVLGACHAVASGVDKHLPGKVQWLWGFTEKPSQQDVISLMAAVIEDAARLHREQSTANARYSAALTADPNVKAADFFGPTLDAHNPQIEKWFNDKGKGAGALWMMERDPAANGGWKNPKRFA